MTYMYGSALFVGPDARKLVFRVCEQQKCRPAGATANMDQRLCYLQFGQESYLNLLQVKQFSVVGEAGLSLTQERFCCDKAQL